MEKEGGLETVPIPDEMGSNAAVRWQNMRAHHPIAADKWAAITKPLVASDSASETDQFMLLLKLVGSAFIPYRVQLDHALTHSIKQGSIVSTFSLVLLNMK